MGKAAMEEKQGTADCPTCGRPMARGRIYSSQGFSLEFLEDGVDPLFLSEDDVTRAGGVVLAPRRMLRVGNISCPAWHCPKCRRVVLAYGAGE